MSQEIPKTMKALYLNAQNELSYVTVPTPVPKYGEVLVKVFAAPINPSDLMFMEGLYPF
jgi:NADPH:quinone reductase-like Zn-dependent oxidoreductase